MNDNQMTIQLSEDERLLLAEVLDTRFRDLRQEIGRTEDYEYRQGLKQREELLRSLLDKLGASPA